MINKSLSYLFCVLFYTLSYSQNTQNVTLKIIDSKSKKEIPYAHVSIGKKHAYAKSNGKVFLSNIPFGSKEVVVTHVGYTTLNKSISIPTKEIIILALTLNNATLSEVVISKKSRKKLSKVSAITSKVNNNYLEKNRDNSLMQTLRDIPGVNAITIGSGQSKPTIRGLGFNRVVVVENGIKHEAQQWGADHGLEIDQYNVEDIEVIKGASSLLYGSDAISGVINLKNNSIPNINSFSGELNLTNRSNNDFYGISVGIKQRYNHWFYKARITHEDYGDFKVPTTKINYDNYIFNLHKNYLRNTAGYNHNIGFSLGYVHHNITSITTFSNINAKNGFFANAHGLEVRTSRINYDESNRDIDLPFHKVNHFKITNNTNISFENNSLDIELGYQKNHREEHSEPVPHGYMPAPDHSMERLFEKSTYTLNIKDQISYFQNHNITTGINLEYQDNNISGWGFLIPAYNRLTVGAFVYDQVKLNKNLYVDGGIRYDYGTLKTQPYYEWFYSPVIDQNGNTTQQKLQRAEERNLNFSNFSASAGISYIKENTSYKINIGKSFRIPLANELASDGVNYHMYRYEEGSLDLDPESSYQIDAEFKTNFNKVDFQLTPFVNYFDNYIYLSPSSEYYQTLQKYQYQQSEVFRYGGEILAHYRPTNSITLSGSLEYVKAKQLSGRKKNFTLPFSPPLTGVLSLEYTLKPWSYFNDINLFASGRFASDQNEIVPPEKTTEGYSLFSLGLRTNVLAFSKINPLKIQGKINNLFNRKAFDHTSFYRLIEVPQPGRNFSITLIQTF
ncbi:iron complex outermembrane recepter protein [Tenacibaculum sp. MAR_2009_124]|uniref:TonB-dependent receptor n=1 Tax=Tenacibaculum sp. MAR_2009_124 TaxID=1250059 RepID=UPI00089CA3D5|nr:TonB-dependent receptor [Tenacibaculum sp. MAR_2009_124]SEC81033.1 iron complex outermembrane recepter protein [Tenacibaculum sp. MAR_2009_124]